MVAQSPCSCSPRPWLFPSVTAYCWPCLFCVLWYFWFLCWIVHTQPPHGLLRLLSYNSLNRRWQFRLNSVLPFAGEAGTGADQAVSAPICRGLYHPVVTCSRTVPFLFLLSQERTELSASCTDFFKWTHCK